MYQGHLSNFQDLARCLATGGHIILLDTNSSGKSTLIQNPPLIKQNVYATDRTAQLHCGEYEANNLFNFGGFEDVLHQGTTGTRQFYLRFNFQYNGNGEQKIHQYPDLLVGCL